MRSLAEDLRSRSDAELERLLALRPDLARPQPGDLTALAARASTLASTTRAIDHLDDEHLRVLEAVALADPAAHEPLSGIDDPVPTGLGELSGLDDDRLVAAVGLLRDAALLWRSPTGLTATRTALDVIGPYPAQLGPRATDLGLALPDLATIHDLRADAPAGARSVLDRLATSGPAAVVDHGSQAEAGALWLADHQLAVVSPTDEDDAQRVTVPREVALALRGGSVRTTRDEGSRPPSAPPVLGGSPDSAAAAVVLDLVALVDEVLEHVESARPRVLRTGGLAVADLRALGRATSLETTDLRFLLDLALGARLLADDRATEPTWRLTTLVETWREAPVGRRWADLVQPWLTSLRSSRPPTEEMPGSARALSDELVWPPIRGLRADVLSLLAESYGPADAASVTGALRARRPRRMPRDADAIVSVLLDETERLGLTAHGTLAGPGAVLVAGDPARAVHLLEEHLPEPVDQALVQADLTAVVPGPPSPALAALLRRSATLESRGGASIYRFDEGSVRQALDSGMDGDQLLAELTAASRTPLPQPLEYLVRDVARRHGQLRAGSVGSYLRSDDEVHLDQLLAHRGLSHLQLRRLAPTVLVSPVAAATLVESLREVGSTPVRESSGGVVSAVGTARRVAPPRVASDIQSPAVDAPALVETMRRGEAAGLERSERPAEGPALPRMDPVDVAGVLRSAAADRAVVWIGVTDQIGDVSRLLLRPESVDGGRVRGTVDDAPRSFSIHRITGVAPAS